MDKNDWLTLAEYLQGKVRDEQGKIEVYSWKGQPGRVVDSGKQLARLLTWERAVMEQAGEDPDANLERLSGAIPPLPHKGDFSQPTAREFSLRVIASGGRYGVSLAYICSVQPYGFTEQEIADALEQLEADGDVTYGETAGEKAYYPKDPKEGWREAAIERNKSAWRE